MVQHVTAIFEQGVLRPLGPLQLREQEIVDLSVAAVSSQDVHTDEHSATLFELLDKAGLIGCIKDASPDLSTNPNNIEGFHKSEG